MRRRLASVLGKLIYAGITVGLIWPLTLALRRWGVGSLPIALVIAVSLAWAVGIAFVLRSLLASPPIKRLAARMSGYWRRLRRPWSRTLLVDADPERGTFTPSVWIRGGRSLRGGRVRLRLLDGDDVVRAASEAPLPATATGEEIHLPPIALPAGATAAEVLGWQWEVSVRGRWRAHARWRERLVAAHRTNAEGELVDTPQAAEPAEPAEAPERVATPETGGAPQGTPESNESLIARLANAILAQAIDHGASDIRLVPRGDCVVLKFRLNGGYSHVLDAPLPVGQDLHSHLQQLFELPRAQGVAQRGTLAATYEGRAVRFEGRSIPAEQGDILHIRILANDEGRGRVA
jgi:hypothetical protein